MSLTEQQLEQRRHGIGSSDIAAIIGANPYRGPFHCWLSKTGRLEATHTEQTDVGDELEEPIARLIARRMKVDIERNRETLVHPAHEIVLATPDFWVKAPDQPRAGLLEIKNVGSRMAHHWTVGQRDGDPHEAPEYVFCQTQWQLGVAGISQGFIGALIGGRTLGVYPVERDDELVGGMIELAETFWKDHVLADVAPSVDGHEETLRWLRSRYAKHTKELVEAPAEADDLVREYLSWCESERRAKEQKELMQARLMELVGDAGGVRGPWGRAVWVEVKECEVAFTKKASRHVRVYPAKESGHGER